MPEIKAKLSTKLEEFTGLKLPNEELLKKKSKLEKQQQKIELQINKIVTLPENIVPFFQPGRLIRVQVKG